MDVLSRHDLATLVSVARSAARAAVVDGRTWWADPDDVPDALHQSGAAFVTLRLGGRLRGCIGTFDASEPLVSTVADRARAAALHDPRFAPVTPDEVDRLEVSVSVLGDPEPLAAVSYDDLRRLVRPGTDGLVVRAGSHRATFLPAVWRDLPEVDSFLEALWRKAGLARTAWPRGIEVDRYTAQEWLEDDTAR